MMKRLIAISAFLLFSIATAQQVNALEVVVADTKVKLATPKGFCLLDKKNPKDNQVIVGTQQALQGRKELLARFAPCDRLKAWREGKAPDLGDSADYQILTTMKAQKVSSRETISSVCTEFRKQGSASVAQGGTDAINKGLDSIKALAGNVKVNSQKMYGVLHEDETGCYAGLIQKIQTPSKVTTAFTVMTVTVVAGKIIYFYHGGDFDDTSVVKRLLDTSRSTMRATLAQN